MSVTPTQSRQSAEEFARRGDEIYERSVRPRLGPGDEGKFAVIDVGSGDFEIDTDELAASDRLRARRPDAQIWLRTVGSRYARRFGARPKPTATPARSHCPAT